MGENTVHLDNELKKIALAHGTGEGVGEREVRALVARTSEVKPWDFTAAFAERNLGKCLALRSKMESTSPHVLIAPVHHAAARGSWRPSPWPVAATRAVSPRPSARPTGA
ncbi:MAG: hypothetical protein ACLTDR_07185 [Adlercreutzia equolifaciens]